ncbi:hypothetical protein NFH98_20695 [Halomonas sp. H33-56]|uniref:hypothetical protein n=1 Tax=Halomonas sp. H33-56 TaxID=2950873 RepID=UPI0032DF79A9
MRQQQERGQVQRRGHNPLVGECAADTIANCHDLVEYLQLSDEDLHPGMRLNLLALRDALGSVQASEEWGGS